MMTTSYLPGITPYSRWMDWLAPEDHGGRGAAAASFLAPPPPQADWKEAPGCTAGICLGLPVADIRAGSKDMFSFKTVAGNSHGAAACLVLAPLGPVTGG